MPSVGIWGIAILALIVLLLFGPKKLPGLGRSLGRGAREFKETVTDQTKELKEATIDTPKQFKEAINPLTPLPEDEPEPVTATAPEAERVVTVTVQEEPMPVLRPSKLRRPSRSPRSRRRLARRGEPASGRRARDRTGRRAAG